MNFLEEEPKSTTLFVLGKIVLLATTISCVGPTLVIGAPSPVEPSCVCPDVLKAKTSKSYSSLNNAELIVSPSENEDCLVYGLAIVYLLLEGIKSTYKP